MARIALTYWVEGARPEWANGNYSLERAKWFVRMWCLAAPDHPLFIVTPHVECARDLEPAVVINCRDWIKRTQHKNCGIVAAQWEAPFDVFDVDSVTLDAMVLRDPRQVMPGGVWSAPITHLPKTRPFADWFTHMPARHPARRFIRREMTPKLAEKHDKAVCDITARYKVKPPQLLKPPIVINGELVAERRSGWEFEVTPETAAVHPHSHTKWPEFIDSHPNFECLRVMMEDAPLVDDIERQREAHRVAATFGVPDVLA